MKIAPWHQSNWDARAAGNFIGGGSGCGLLIFAAASSGSPSDYRWQALTALALIASGLLCVLTEIGRPLRALNVFLHPQTSWMTREAMVAPFLFTSGAFAIRAGGGTASVLAALFALAYLYCQARMLAAAKGIPAWREPKIVPLMIVTGLVEGAGWSTLLATLLSGAAPKWQAGVLLGALLARRLAWKLYSEALIKQGAPKKALEVLQRFAGPFSNYGQSLPEMLIVAALFFAAEFVWLLPLAGAAAAFSGWLLKFTIVARAAYNQGFALPVLPVRGQGPTMPGVKPGWTSAHGKILQDRSRQT